MENEKSTLDNIVDSAKEYINARQELATLKMAEKGSKAISGATAGLLVAILFLLIILFASVALGFTLSNCFGSPALGFLGVAGFYLFLLVIVLLNKEKWIITPMTNTIIKNIFNNDDNGKD